MSKQSEFTKCLLSQIGKGKIHGEEFFSPRQKELFPGLKRDLNMEIEDAAKSDDPLEACMERRGYKPGKTQVFQEAISAKLTGDMFGKQEKLTGAEAMFQEQMQECLDKLKNKPKLKFGGTEREKIEKKAQANLQKRIQSGHKSAEIRYTELVNRSDAQILRDMDALGQSWLGRYSDIFEKQTEGRPDIVKSRWRKLMADNDLKLDVIKKDDVVWILPLEQWEIAKREGITPGVFVEYGNRIWEVTFVNKRDWAGTVSLARKTSSGAPESCSKVPISILRVVDKPVNKMIVGKEGQMTLFGQFKKGDKVVKTHYYYSPVDNKTGILTKVWDTPSGQWGTVFYGKNQSGQRLQNKFPLSVFKKVEAQTRKTIPEQADFINPSQMTLFGRLILRKLAMRGKG